MDYGGKSLSHIGRCSELRDVLESSSDLITHGDANVITGHQSFVVDQRLRPYFCIHFILSIQMSADFVLEFCDRVQFFLPVDAHSGHCLSELGPTLVFVELFITHYYYRKFF